MQANIVNHKISLDAMKKNTLVSIKSKTILSISELQYVLECYGYRFTDDLYLEIKVTIPLGARIQGLLELIKSLQDHITKHTTCMFDFTMTRNKNCITKVSLR